MARHVAKPAFVGRSYTIPAPRKETVTRMPAGFRYSSGRACTDKFGKLKRGKCLVQLAFREGQPMIRFCIKVQKPGRIIPVRSASEAYRTAAEGCACVERRGAKKCFTGAALGRTRRKRAR